MNQNSGNQESRGPGRKPGPRTPHGKLNSKFNALKTGIFAKTVLTGKAFNERREDFDNLVAHVRQSIDPRDQLEEILVESLTLELLRLVRVYQADAEVAPLLFRSIREKFESDREAQVIAQLVGEASASTDPKLPAAELLMRYETAIWRQVDRMLERIEQLRRIHNSSPRTRSAKEGRR